LLAGLRIRKRFSMAFSHFTKAIQIPVTREKKKGSTGQSVACGRPCRSRACDLMYGSSEKNTQ
jgi:hypothetical protein